MRASYPLYRLGLWLGGRLPDAAVWRLADWVSDVQWRQASADRDTVGRNLSLVLGAPVSARSPLVRDVFRNFGRYLAEFFQGLNGRPVELHVDGQHHLEAASAAGRGTILLSAHVGNWELLGALIVQRWRLPLSSVVLPHGDARVDALFNRQRERHGIRVIPLGLGTTADCLSVLRRGQYLGLIGDWDFGTGGMPIPLFGRLVRLPRGPAVLSLRSRAPILPVFLLREGRWTFRISIEPPIWPSSQDGAEPASAREDSRLQDLMTRYASALERSIRRAPTQWLLFRPLAVPSTPPS